MKKQTDIESTRLPLEPIVCQILLVLLERERHGYSIVRQIERQAEAGMALTEWMFEADANKARKHMSRANAHAVHGEKDVAIASYEKVLALNPENESAKERLEAVRAYRR